MRLGVLCNTNKGNPQKPAGRFTPRLERLIQANPGEWEIYLIRPSELYKNYVNGYYFENGKWTMKKAEYPDVVYSRLPNRTSDARAVNAYETLEAKEIPVFNKGFFNKQMIYDITKEHPSVPETQALNETTFNDMLQKYETVYIKPIGSSFGKGVYKVEGKVATDADGRKKRFGSQKQLISYFANMSKPYIVQQNIPGATIDDRALDFRVVTQRDKNGEWVVTISAAKLAAPGKPTPHLARGGTLLDVDETIKQIHAHWRKTKQRMFDTCIELARLIQGHYEEGVGEIGFDMKIDTTGKPWMVEANSRPGHEVYMHTPFQDQVNEACRMIYEYAEYLIGGGGDE